MSFASLPRNGFTFKQFFVAHDRCAMKVGTDAVILGAWVPLGVTTNILDIGSGSGILALMLAQRLAGKVNIDAVELDSAACQQARENVAISSWPTAIRLIEQDILLYSEQVGRTERRYDLIISNPPYFSSGSDCSSDKRNLARYTSSLSHQGLLQAADRLLAPEGRFCLMLPCADAQLLQQAAEQSGWYCGQRLWVRDREERPAHLLLLELAKKPLSAADSELTIRTPERVYTQEYRQLTREFYLAF